MGSGGGGGGGESGGAGGECRERWEPNKSSRERCFCRMLLEMTRGVLMEGGEGWGDGDLGGGTHVFFIEDRQENVQTNMIQRSISFEGTGFLTFCGDTGPLFLSLARASSLGSFFLTKWFTGGL